MPTVVTAKPASFMLKVRIVAPDGTPFFDRWYRVQWGEEMFPPRNMPPKKTDRHGTLSMLLPAPSSRVPQGAVQVLDVSGRNENVIWNIPIQLAEDPPVATLPGIERAPAPPPSGASQDEVLTHEQEMAKYRVRVLVQIRERIFEFQQSLDLVRNFLVVQPFPPGPTSSDDELWETWLAFVEAFTVIVHGYEVAWRLWNLAQLPLAEEPQVPFFSSGFEMLLRGIDRFAFRHQLPVFPQPVTPESVGACLEKLKETHDRRGPVV